MNLGQVFNLSQLVIVHAGKCLTVGLLGREGGASSNCSVLSISGVQYSQPWLISSYRHDVTEQGIFKRCSPFASLTRISPGKQAPA